MPLLATVSPVALMLLLPLAPSLIVTAPPDRVLSVSVTVLLPTARSIVPKLLTFLRLNVPASVSASVLDAPSPMKIVLPNRELAVSTVQVAPASTITVPKLVNVVPSAFSVPAPTPAANSIVELTPPPTTLPPNVSVRTEDQPRGTTAESDLRRSTAADRAEIGQRTVDGELTCQIERAAGSNRHQAADGDSTNVQRQRGATGRFQCTRAAEQPRSVDREGRSAILRCRVDHAAVDQGQVAVADNPGAHDHVVCVGQGIAITHQERIAAAGGDGVQQQGATAGERDRITNGQECVLSIPADLRDRSQVVDRAQKRRRAAIRRCKEALRR